MGYGVDMTTPVPVDKDKFSSPVFEKPVKLGERLVTMRTPNETQYMQISHQQVLLMSDSVPIEKKQQILNRLYRTFMSLITDENDQSYVEDAMADGTVRLSDLAHALGEVFASANSEIEDSAPKVRRGRPSKSR